VIIGIVMLVPAAVLATRLRFGWMVDDLTDER
jgi:hypothetical protein